MISFLQRGENKYEQKYLKDIPVYPSKKDISIVRLNDFYGPFYKNHYEKRIPSLKKITKGLPIIPDEIWCIILEFLLHIEKNDKDNYYDWLYSPYSIKSMKGMKLRSRQLYLPNILGIVLNEGINIINCAERCLNHTGFKKKILIENLSIYFIKYVVKWYHWINELVKYNKKTSFQHFIYELQRKTKYFMNEVDTKLYTETAYKNFYYLDYFINTYYPNYQFDCLTYKDIDFETFIFQNNYYKRVYRKGMLLRNYKRINLFLHE